MSHIPPEIQRFLKQQGVDPAKVLEYRISQKPALYSPGRKLIMEPAEVEVKLQPEAEFIDVHLALKAEGS